MGANVNESTKQAEISFEVSMPVSATQHKVREAPDGSLIRQSRLGQTHLPTSSLALSTADDYRRVWSTIGILMN